MNIDRLLSFTRNTALLKQDDSQDLEGLLAEYPYFSAAQLLLAMKYQQQNSSRYNRQLQKTAVYIADRAKLMSVLSAEIDQLNSFDLQWDKMAEAAVDAKADVSIAEVVDEKEAEITATLVRETQTAEEVKAEIIEKSEEQHVEELSNNDEPESEIKETLEAVSNFESTETATDETTVIDLSIAENEAINLAITSEEEEAPTASVAAEKATAEAELAENSELTVEEAEQIETPASEAVFDQATKDTIHAEIVEAESNSFEDTNSEIQAGETESDEESEIAATFAAVEEFQSTNGAITFTEEETIAATTDVVSSEKIPAAPFEFVLPAQTNAEQKENVSAEVSISQPSIQEFSQKAHDRLSWFRFFAGKPLREQSDEVLDALYQEHMGGDFLQAPSATIAEIKSELKAVINHEAEVASNKALESEIRRLAYESISDEELPASETLAGIYESQQDYKRALRIYQKLMLKFPDRMSYFAGLIEQTKTKLTN